MSKCIKLIEKLNSILESYYETSEDSGHYHTVKIDDNGKHDGMGMTIKTISTGEKDVEHHTHNIINYEVKPSGDHNHDLGIDAESEEE